MKSHSVRATTIITLTALATILGPVARPIHEWKTSTCLEREKERVQGKSPRAHSITRFSTRTPLFKSLPVDRVSNGPDCDQALKSIMRRVTANWCNTVGNAHCWTRPGSPSNTRCVFLLFCCYCSFAVKANSIIAANRIRARTSSRSFRSKRDIRHFIDGQRAGVE